MTPSSDGSCQLVFFFRMYFPYSGFFVGFANCHFSLGGFSVHVIIFVTLFARVGCFLSACRFHYPDSIWLNLTLPNLPMVPFPAYHSWLLSSSAHNRGPLDVASIPSLPLAIPHAISHAFDMQSAMCLAVLQALLLDLAVCLKSCHQSWSWGW